MESNIISDRFKYTDSFSNCKVGNKSFSARKSIERKLKEGVYRHENAACFCGSSSSMVIAEIDKYGLYYSFVICKNCGIMRANPRLTQKSLNEFYDKEFRDLDEDNVDKNKSWSSLLIQAENNYNFLVPYLNSSMKVVFEIGCYMGAYLFPFWQRGWDVAGVDLDSENIEFGRSTSGINSLYAGGIEKLESLDKKADLIICNHVVEHFVDLEKELKRIRELLKPNGLFFVGVPGTFWWPFYAYKGDFLQCLRNDHCWQFTLSSLRYVMECMGFSLIYGDEIIRTLLKRTDKFRDKKDILMGECERVINFLSKFEKRRFLNKIKSILYGFIVRIIGAIGAKAMLKRMLGKK